MGLHVSGKRIILLHFFSLKGALSQYLVVLADRTMDELKTSISLSMGKAFACLLLYSEIMYLEILTGAIKDKPCCQQTSRCLQDASRTVPVLAPRPQSSPP